MVWVVAVVVASPAMLSYASMAEQPSSLPLSVRSVEWVRQHHGNWLVDTAEHLYFGYVKTPQKGGPGLTALPSVGLASPAPVPTPAGSPHQVTTGARSSRSAELPTPIAPLISPALPGEGSWRPTGTAVEGGPPVLVSVFRPEPSYPHLVAYVAWFDHHRTQLGYYPGRYEPPRAAVRGSASVPQSQRGRLVASFNAAFVYSDGLNGSSDNGRTNEPMKNGLATLVGYRDGQVDIIIWQGGRDAGPKYTFTRQSLPPILWDNQLNPHLDDSRQWGATLGHAVRVWRTGVGIDTHGNVIYAAADGQTVESLARLLRHAGAVKAMQFDINPEWPSLITYRHTPKLIADKIVPNYQQKATRYLVPDDRDFFAVYSPPVTPVTVPFN